MTRFYSPVKIGIEIANSDYSNKNRDKNRTFATYYEIDKY
jgi:hypothetical protein